LTLTQTESTTARPTAKKIELGFLSNVPFSELAPGGTAQGLKDAVELFRIAERLGYDKGWVRNRHFDNYNSSPLTLLGVAGQHTERIKLGTAIIPVGYEHPIRLAEDAATVDLLVDERLEIGIAGGIPMFDQIFHQDDRPWEEASQERVRGFLAAVRGEVVGAQPNDGVGYTVRPHSPTLIDRIWYGPGSVDSAIRTAEQGMDLLLSAIGPKGLPFEEGQLEQIRAHRAAWTRTDRAPRVSAARLFFPALNDRQRKLYQGYADLRAKEGPAASRPAGALAPTDRSIPASVGSMAMSPVVVGEPAEIVEYLCSDVAVAEAGELMIFLPPGFSHAEYVELLENIAEHVAGELGWTPASTNP
jgi:alkanesulfonate monooxygenase SsuD/methylene tetrahydromethanopterin reductase-like flavin-dependent oxidoreductase (luciferase family)